jgi:hypothetical protein
MTDLGRPVVPLMMALPAWPPLAVAASSALVLKLELLHARPAKPAMKVRFGNRTGLPGRISSREECRSPSPSGERSAHRPTVDGSLVISSQGQCRLPLLLESGHSTKSDLRNPADSLRFTALAATVRNGRFPYARFSGMGRT